MKQKHDDTPGELAEESTVFARDMTEEEQRIYRRGLSSLSAVNKTWRHWLNIGEVLVIGRRWALRESNSNAPNGRRYTDAFSWWLSRHKQFDKKLDPKERADLLTIMESPEILAWRGTIADDDKNYDGKLSPMDRRRWNNPRSVLAAYKAMQNAHKRELDKQNAQKAIELALKADNGEPMGAPIVPPRKPLDRQRLKAKKVAVSLYASLLKEHGRDGVRLIIGALAKISDNDPREGEAEAAA